MPSPAFLRTLPAVRQTCSKVWALGAEGKLNHFNVHLEKLDDVIDYCGKIILRDFGTQFELIPPHSRWRHFCTPKDKDLLAPLIASWTSAGVTSLDIAKRLIDLFVVSVLLDAGAGNLWTYKDISGECVNKSEGLAVASLRMFESGLFSSGASFEVNAGGLKLLSQEKIAKGLQVNEKNPMSGLEGRSSLLIKLASALELSPEIFGSGDGARPGNMIDFLSSSEGFEGTIDVATVWSIVMDGFGPVWPAARTSLQNVSLGDAWHCDAVRATLNEAADDSDDIVVFHKLSQWLTYSLLEPMKKILGWRVLGQDELTGLPEYRNGGLLVDLGFLTLKSVSCEIPRFAPNDQVIIEWRALTVIALDKIAEGLRLHLNAPALTTPQVLESATWKGGREIARELRAGGGPPIEIISDGTVF